VKQADGSAFNFTGATGVKFSMKDQAGALKIDSAVAEFKDADPTLGRLQYKWVTADTDTEGDYCAEFDVQYPASEELTVPINGDIRVQIYADVNDA
jgi:hypothetical protein